MPVRLTRLTALNGSLAVALVVGGGVAATSLGTTAPSGPARPRHRHHLQRGVRQLFARE